MKKLILLLLFIPLVSFGQEDVDFDSNLNLTVKDSTKNYFGIGFKVESSFQRKGLDTGTSKKIAKRLLKNMIVIDLNYVINNFSIGVEYGRDIEGNIYLGDAMRRNLYKFGLRVGYKALNDKVIFTSTNGIHYIEGESRVAGYVGNYDTSNYKKFYTKFSAISNSKYKLVPEIGVGTDGFSLGLVYFFKPKYSKRRAIKKLTQAKNALDLELITQEEYDKIYIKYFKNTKN